MDNKIQLLLKKIIKLALRDLGITGLGEKEIYIDFPSEGRFGDLYTNCALRASKVLKKPPFEVATDLAAHIKKYLENSKGKEYIREVKAEGAGFVNFYLDNKYFHAQLKKITLRGRNALRIKAGGCRRVLVEFVSANPTGPLSVAHARQAVVGDVLANILDFLGFRVKREYYLNDEGNQINILGMSIDMRLKELSGEHVDFPQDYYQGEYIYAIAKSLKDEIRKEQDTSQYGMQYILKGIKKDLNDFGLRFDYWYSQRDLRKSGKIRSALALLKKRGFIYEQDGAQWFKSTEFGDDKDRVVVKSDGSYTYLAPDIAYHRDKFRRGFSWLINLWGPDHHGYINRLKAAIMALGKPSESLSVIIVQLASIFREGQPLHMSTRKGQYITLREVLDEVGCDASRLFFLMRRTASHLDFDLEAAKKQTPENPVYYIQYAHARICSILRNNPSRIKARDVDFTLLKEQEETSLIKKIWQFSYILDVCVKTQDPYMLTVYLQDLSCLFHKFYDRHRVLGQDTALTEARAALLEATRIVIACGLDLLGISKPERM